MSTAAKGTVQVTHRVRQLTHRYAPAAEQLDDTLLALADRTRRAILQRLSRGETRVTELAAPFDMSLNAVSKPGRCGEVDRDEQNRLEGAPGKARAAAR